MNVESHECWIMNVESHECWITPIINHTWSFITTNIKSCYALISPLNVSNISRMSVNIYLFTFTFALLPQLISSYWLYQVWNYLVQNVCLWHYLTGFTFWLFIFGYVYVLVISLVMSMVIYLLPNLYKLMLWFPAWNT
jgi:hypothetical protein